MMAEINDFEDLEKNLQEEDQQNTADDNKEKQVFEDIQNQDAPKNDGADDGADDGASGEPATEPAKIDEPAQEPATSIDWSKFGDGFTDENSVKEFIEKSRTANEQVEQLSSKVKELESKNPFSDESLFKLDYIKRNDPDKFDTAKDLLFGKPESLDILKMQLEGENEAFKNASEEDKVAYLRRQYKLSHNLKELDPEDYSEDEVQARKDQIREADEEVRVAKMKLGIDAENAKRKLSSDLFGEIQVPQTKSSEESERERGEALEALKGSWDVVMSKLPVKELSIDLPSSDGKSTNQFLKLDIPQQESVKYKTELRDIMASNGTDPSGIDPKDIASYVQNRYREDNFAEIMTAAVKKASAMGENEIRKVFYNTQKPVESTDVDGKAPVSDERTTEAEVNKALSSF